jgi:hypothetical protein
MMGDIEQLQHRIAELEGQVRHLQESVGKWRRKAQEAAPRFTYVSERHERGMHYISIPVADAPSDLTLHEIQQHVRDNLLPQYYPYRYYNVYTSKRHDGWVTTLVKEDNVIEMER